MNYDRRWNAGRITAIFSEMVIGEMYRAAGQLVVDTLLHPQIPEHVKVQVVQQILYWMHSHLSIEMISIEEAILHAATQYMVFLESGRGEYRNFLLSAKTEQDVADLPPNLPPAEWQAQDGFFESISRLCHDEGGQRLTDSIRNQKSNLLAICHEWWPTKLDELEGPTPETN